jgi:glycosyltransferase involved in cell wall biosynthesis
LASFGSGDREIAVTKPQRILIACDYFWPSVGGVEKAALNLGSEFLKRGFQVHIATRALKNRTALSYEGLDILPMKHKRSWIGALAPAKDRRPVRLIRLQKRILRGGYRAVVLMADPLCDWILWSIEGISKPSNTRLIVQPLINREGYQSWKDDGVFRGRLSRVLKSADSVAVLTGDGVDKAFCEEEGIGTVHIPNATRERKGRGSFRDRVGIPRHAFFLLQVANLWPVKNHIGIVRSLQNLDGDWRFVIIGFPSNDRNYYEMLKESVARDRRILLIPGLDEEGVAGAMDDADLVLLASHGEVSPLCILEAMSHGKPWMATPTCGAVHDFAGGIVRPLEDFVAMIRRFQANSELGARFGRVGKQHWEHCFSWDIVGDAWHDLVVRGSSNRSFRMPTAILEAMRKVNDEMFGPDQRAKIT